MFHGLAYDLLFPAILIAWLLVWRRLRYPVAPIALLVASFFASIAYSFQHAGWVYQAIPRKAFLLGAAFWLAGELLAPRIARLRPDGHLRLVTATLLVLTTLPTALFALQRFHQARQPHRLSLEQQIYAGLPPGTTVYVLSTNFFGFADVLHDRLLWGGRYVHLWMLPAIVLNQIGDSGGPAPAVTLPPARVQQLATLLHSNLADDLQTFAPAVILVEHCTSMRPCQALDGVTFDTLAWFQQSSAFAAQWQHYRFQKSADGYDLYTRTAPQQRASPQP
jgi:hypothetical protein